MRFSSATRLARLSERLADPSLATPAAVQLTPEAHAAIRDAVIPRTVSFATGAVTAFAIVPVRVEHADLHDLLVRPGRGYAKRIEALHAFTTAITAALDKHGAQLVAPPHRDDWACREWASGFFAWLERCEIAKQRKPVRESLAWLAAPLGHEPSRELETADDFARDPDDFRRIARMSIARHVDDLHRAWMRTRRRAT